MQITNASKKDIAELVKLINSAYRGEVSKLGWTTEAGLLAGDLRTDYPTLAAQINKPGSVILKYTAPQNSITGCVYLQIQEKGLYLGMLSVAPVLQGKGIGKLLLAAAETFAFENKCNCIFMQVISVRTELIAWYQLNGYNMTGEKKALPDDNRFGIPTQPLEFAIMKKNMIFP